MEGLKSKVENSTKHHLPQKVSDELTAENRRQGCFAILVLIVTKQAKITLWIIFRVALKEVLFRQVIFGCEAINKKIVDCTSPPLPFVIAIGNWRKRQLWQIFLYFV